MAEPKLTEMEQVELEYKRLQVEMMRHDIAERIAKRDRQEQENIRQLADFKKGEQIRVHRQTVCKHRKGGRDNKFAKGTDANYSVNLNTYPGGRMVIMCTRCGKEVEKPAIALKKSDPKVYALMWAEWQKWLEYPTDNSPSGSKIFEINEAA